MRATARARGSSRAGPASSSTCRVASRPRRAGPVAKMTSRREVNRDAPSSSCPFMRIQIQRMQPPPLGKSSTIDVRQRFSSPTTPRSRKIMMPYPQGPTGCSQYWNSFQIITLLNTMKDCKTCRLVCDLEQEVPPIQARTTQGKSSKNPIQVLRVNPGSSDPKCARGTWLCPQDFETGHFPIDEACLEYPGCMQCPRMRAWAQIALLAVLLGACSARHIQPHTVAVRAPDNGAPYGNGTMAGDCVGEFRTL